MRLIRFDHLCLLIMLCGAGIMISLARTLPADFWWHLKIGELIATEGLPTTNRFAWTLPADTPFVYQSWLGEWLFYMLYSLGGLPLVIFMRNLLWLVACSLVAVDAWRRSNSWLLAALMVALLTAMTLNAMTTRTQNWSWVPFMLVVLLLGAYRSGQIRPYWLLALPLIMVFWVNAHGAFVMGGLVTGAVVVGETLRRLLGQTDALSWRALIWLYLAAAGMGLAMLVNPLGLGVFGYVFTLLTDAPSQDLVIEWQPPNPDDLIGMVFYLSMLLLLAAVSLGRRRPTITDMLLVCGLAWMAFNGVRYVVWFGMVALPLIAGCVAGPSRKPLRGTLPNTLVAAMMITMLLLVQPWAKPLLPWPDPYRAQFAPVPGAPLLFASTTPVDATEHLRTEPCTGNLYNEAGYGSYLIWAAYPDVPVFIDPRVELFPLDLWEDYIRITRGEDLPRLLAEYDIACVLLDREKQPRLAEALPGLEDWQRTYHDEQSEVWRHTP